jgi:adducin
VIHPFGLLYSEVTASSLETIDLDGEVLEHGSTSLGINKAGFILHSFLCRMKYTAQAIGESDY